MDGIVNSQPTLSGDTPIPPAPSAGGTLSIDHSTTNSPPPPQPTQPPAQAQSPAHQSSPTPVTYSTVTPIYAPQATSVREEVSVGQPKVMDMTSISSVAPATAPVAPIPAPMSPAPALPSTPPTSMVSKPEEGYDADKINNLEKNIENVDIDRMVGGRQYTDPINTAPLDPIANTTTPTSSQTTATEAPDNFSTPVVSTPTIQNTPTIQSTPMTQNAPQPPSPISYASQSVGGSGDYFQGPSQNQGSLGNFSQNMKNNPNLKKILIIVAAIIVVGIIVGVLAFSGVFSGQKKAEQTSETTTSQSESNQQTANQDNTNNSNSGGAGLDDSTEPGSGDSLVGGGGTNGSIGGETPGGNTTTDGANDNSNLGFTGGSNEPDTTEVKTANTGLESSPTGDTPTWIKINKLGINAPVDTVGLTASYNIAAPSNIWHAGWYNGSAKVGKGATLIDGHSSADGGALFGSLSSLSVGDVINIKRADGNWANYKVKMIKNVDRNAVDMQSMLSVYGGGSSGLNLMTCIGNWIPAEQTLSNRLLVYSVQV